MDKIKLADSLTEIVAMKLHVLEQRVNGIWPPDTNFDYMKRYMGAEVIPKNCVEYNLFKTEVDHFVYLIMGTIQDNESPAQQQIDKTKETLKHRMP